MSRAVQVISAGPAVSIQDLGRPGFIAQGLTQGGAMDPLALHEAAALLDQPVSAALEMIGAGGVFVFDQDTRIALTGAPMQASLGDGTALTWHASHLIPAGTELRIGGVRSGAIGYLSFGGGLDTPVHMGAQSAHVTAGLGAQTRAGDVLPLRGDTGTRVGYVLTPQDRFSGGALHMVRSLQSHIYGADLLAEFAATPFTRDARANRQGIRMSPPEGVGFQAQDSLTVVSEIIAPGDIQVTGDGAPFVLMREHQTTGGYPRIGTVVPSDVARVAQTPLNAPIRFVLLDLEDALAYEHAATAARARLPHTCQPLIRDPADIPDLLGYTLIDGVIDALKD